MSEQQPTAKETARQARKLKEHGNNMKVPPRERHESINQAKALRAGQGA